MSKKTKRNIKDNKGNGRIEKNDKIPKPVPQNCKNPCSYGGARSFCFPCYKKLLEQHRERRYQT